MHDKDRDRTEGKLFGAWKVEILFFMNIILVIV